MMHIVLVQRLVRTRKGRGRHTVVGHITFNERGCDSKACEGCGDESELHVCCLGVVNRRCCSSATAMVDLPEADNPVSHNVRPFCLVSFARSSVLTEPGWKVIFVDI